MSSIGGFTPTYDSNGDALNDGLHTYTYDAENRVTQVDGGATATYVYDAEGRRSTKTTGGIVSDYVYDLSGRAVAIYGDGCNITCWARGYVYADGRLIAEYGIAPRTSFKRITWAPRG